MSVPLVRLARRGLQAAAILAALVLLGACGPANGVSIEFNGYTIQPSTTTSKAGDVVFNIINKNGQVLHQLLIVQTDTPASQLHLGSDGKVDENGLNIVGKVDKVDLGQSATLTARLAPGHYVLLCNIVGHYQLGMHADITVTP